MMISNKHIMNNFINKLIVYYYKKLLGISWKIRIAQKLTKKKKTHTVERYDWTILLNK
jgi:hypothetical protein